VTRQTRDPRLWDVLVSWCNRCESPALCRQAGCQKYTPKACRAAPNWVGVPHREQCPFCCACTPSHFGGRTEGISALPVSTVRYPVFVPDTRGNDD
jgi:hypothetical protein